MTTQRADSEQPGRAARVRVERVDAQDPRLRLKPVARRIALGESASSGSISTRSTRERRQALREREPDRPDARADVDNPALASVARRRDEESRVRTDPMAAARLEERKRAAEPFILGQPVGARSAFKLRRRLSHRAVPWRAPHRRGDAPSPRRLVRVDQNPSWQKTERAFDGGHVLVGDEIGDPLRLQDQFDDSDEHKIVGAQDFDQNQTSIGSLAASVGRLYGRGAGSGKGMLAWELSFLSKTNRPIL